MQGRQKRMERKTNPLKACEQPAIRRSSLSAMKLFSQLSMSFYDESTIRRNKQVILDNCTLEFKQKQPKSGLLHNSKAKLVKSVSRKRRKDPNCIFFAKEKDDMDFRTTQDSKVLSKDEMKRSNSRQTKNNKNASTNKSKGNSLQKFRKMLLADLVQTRVKTPKTLNHKKQGLAIKKL